MNTTDDKFNAEEPDSETAAGWRLMGKLLLLSVVVLFVLILLENLWVQFNEKGKLPEQIAAPNEPAQSVKPLPNEPAQPVKPLPDETTQPAKPLHSNVGKSFDSRAAFAKYQQSQGFVVLGRFEDQWPAEIVAERAAMNEISFVRSNGTKHRYPGYDGYQLKVVRLKPRRGPEAVLVLRSKEKRTP